MGLSLPRYMYIFDTAQKQTSVPLRTPTVVMITQFSKNLNLSKNQDLLLEIASS
jgi:hypothetical protein